LLATLGPRTSINKYVAWNTWKCVPHTSGRSYLTHIILLCIQLKGTDKKYYEWWAESEIQLYREKEKFSSNSLYFEIYEYEASGVQFGDLRSILFWSSLECHICSNANPRPGVARGGPTFFIFHANGDTNLYSCLFTA
jgi:hypothetical protein